MEMCSINKNIEATKNNTSVEDKYFISALTELVNKHKFDTATIYLYTSPLLFSYPVEIRLGKDYRFTNKYYSYPVFYQRKAIAEIRFPHELSKSQQIGTLPALSQEVALLIKRFQATELVPRLAPGYLPGYSQEMSKLEKSIEKAASAKFPVIIESGTGGNTLAVATTIHANSRLQDEPFYEINCVNPDVNCFRQQLQDKLTMANTGTFFIHGVDELSIEQQDVLTELLSYRYGGKNASTRVMDLTQFRLIVSSEKKLTELVANGSFSGRLYNQLNYLTLTFPDLAQRKSDIPLLATKLLEQYRLHSSQHFSRELLDCFVTYHWPGNDKQLEQVITRLVCFGGLDEISLKDFKLACVDLLYIQQDNNPGKKVDLKSPDELVNVLMERDYDVLKALHSSLRKALVYLAEHYTQDISLGALSDNAFVSASHLSYLFKSSLGASFKQILSRLRVERAKVLLQEAPNSRITDVCLEVGFGDLSHFEKIFRRITHMTPRDFKAHIKRQLLVQ